MVLSSVGRLFLKHSRCGWSFSRSHTAVSRALYRRTLARGGESLYQSMASSTDAVTEQVAAMDVGGKKKPQKKAEVGKEVRACTT